MDAEIAAKPVEYTDPAADSDWGDEKLQAPELSDVRHVMQDFNGAKGLSGKTDLTTLQAVLLTQIRLLQEDYHARFPELHLDKLPEWFEIYRLSIGRGSRKESVDILKGNVSLLPNPNALPVPGSKTRW